MTTPAAAAHRSVEVLGDGRYRVAGGAEPHIVTVHANGPLCDGGAFRHRGGSCKHIRTVLEAQNSGASIPPAAEVPGLGAGGPGLELDVPLPEPTLNGKGRRAKAAPAPRFHLYTADELLALPAPAWLLAGHIPENSLTVLYGPPGVGKSFLALGQALAIAAEAPWLGCATRWGPVLFVAAEGGANLSQRVQAYRDAHEITTHVGGKPRSDKVRFLREPVNLLSEHDVDAMLASWLALELGFNPALVVFDTFSRCLIGGDENSAQDVGRAIAATDRIRRATNAAVLLVHHTGKDGLQERGSSALRGAADAMFALKGEDGVLTLECTKQKDAAPIAPRQLRLRPIGGSCVLEPREAASEPKGVTKSQRTMLETLRDVADTAEGAACSTVIRASRLSERTAYAALRALKACGYITQVKRRYVLTPFGEASLLQPAEVLQ